MNPSFLILLSFLIGGGSGDLLDYVPTQSYWRDHGVDVTFDTMLHEAGPGTPQDITALIADLGAADPHARDGAAEKIIKLGAGVLPQLREAAKGDDPEVADRSAFLMKMLRPQITVAAVRRLMALRALGELKDAKALPFLESQLASSEMFVPDYARSAIGAIKGGRIVRVVPKEAINDAWLLPSNCRAVAQLRPRSSGPIDADQAAAKLAVRQGQDAAQLVANLSRTALNLAEQLGDIRIDALSAGVSENIDDNHGSLTIIANGQFDSANAARVLRGQKTATHAVDGVDVFEPDRESTILLPSDHEFVLLVAPAGEQTQLQEMIGTIKTRQQTLRKSPEMVALVEPILAADDPGHALWMAVKVTDAYRKLTGLDGFNTLTLIGDEKAGSLNLTARAQSPDAQTAAAAVEQLRRLDAEGVALLKTILPMQPSMQPAADFLATFKVQNDGDVVTGSATLQESLEALYMFPLIVGTTLHEN